MPALPPPSFASSPYDGRAWLSPHRTTPMLGTLTPTAPSRLDAPWETPLHPYAQHTQDPLLFNLMPEPIAPSSLPDITSLSDLNAKRVKAAFAHFSAALGQIAIKVDLLVGADRDQSNQLVQLFEMFSTLSREVEENTNKSEEISSGLGAVERASHQIQHGLDLHQAKTDKSLSAMASKIDLALKTGQGAGKKRVDDEATLSRKIIGLATKQHVTATVKSTNDSIAGISQHLRAIDDAQTRTLTDLAVDNGLVKTQLLEAEQDIKEVKKQNVALAGEVATLQTQLREMAATLVPLLALVPRLTTIFAATTTAQPAQSASASPLQPNLDTLMRTPLRAEAIAASSPQSRSNRSSTMHSSQPGPSRRRRRSSSLGALDPPHASAPTDDRSPASRPILASRNAEPAAISDLRPSRAVPLSLHQLGNSPSLSLRQTQAAATAPSSARATTLYASPTSPGTGQQAFHSASANWSTPLSSPKQLALLRSTVGDQQRRKRTIHQESSDDEDEARSKKRKETGTVRVQPLLESAEEVKGDEDGEEEEEPETQD